MSIHCCYVISWLVMINSELSCQCRLTIEEKERSLKAQTMKPCRKPDGEWLFHVFICRIVSFLIAPQRLEVFVSSLFQTHASCKSWFTALFSVTITPPFFLVFSQIFIHIKTGECKTANANMLISSHILIFVSEHKTKSDWNAVILSKFCWNWHFDAIVQDNRLV